MPEIDRIREILCLVETGQRGSVMQHLILRRCVDMQSSKVVRNRDHGLPDLSSEWARGLRWNVMKALRRHLQRAGIELQSVRSIPDKKNRDKCKFRVTFWDGSTADGDVCIPRINVEAMAADVAVHLMRRARKLEGYYAEASEALFRQYHPGE
jgi:hypothetical protein